MKLAKAFADIDSGDKEPAETTTTGYMTIGSVEGTGTVTISACEVVIPSRKVLAHLVRFEVALRDEYTNDGLTSITIEDAEKLLTSLESLAKAKISTDRFELTEVAIVVGDLRIVLFNTDRGQLHVAVDVNGSTCHLLSQSDVLSLHKLVSLAVAHLQAKSP